MESEAKSGAAGPICYDEFEPYCQWKHDKARDTIMIHLPEFKKEELKVLLNDRGVLKVSGERAIDATNKSKFYKEVVVPKNCDRNAIQAKFTNSQKLLQIIMPKSLNAVVIPEQSRYQRVAVNIGMLAVVLAALVAFIVYMYKSTVLED